MSPVKFEIVVPHQCILGEGPVWDQDQERIIWVDIVHGMIHTFSPEDCNFSSWPVGEMIGSLALTTGGLIVAALESGFYLLDAATKEKRPIIDPERHISGNRFNEGKCDPAGRFWAGTLPLSEDRAAGSLYMLDHDLSVEKKIDQVTISNGMAWSMNGETFYFIDSPTHCVVAYDYDIISGNISNKRICIRIDKAEGTPDGMTIDEEGMLWIAHWGGWKVARWNPDNGQKLFQINLPVSQVTSCTFGGKDLNDLYITTASKQLSEKQLREEPLAGTLFVVPDCGFKGLPPVRFGGSSHILPFDR